MKNYITNPFQFEGIVTGGNFCERTEDIDGLLEYMYSGNNVIISMKRRVGKSSIIKEIFENHISQDKVLTAYVDIYGITSTKELYIALKEEVEKIGTLSFRMGIVLDKLKNAFSDAVLQMEVGSSNKVSIDFHGEKYGELIKKLLLNLELYASENKLRIVFAIDEFQKIASLHKTDMEDIEFNIRSAMQTCKNICFVISGSNQTLLDSMFQDDKPLYRQGAHYNLEPISKEVFYSWVVKKFSLKEIIFSEDAFSCLYELANSEAKIIQQVCFNLFSRFKELETIEADNVIEVIKKIYKGNNDIMTKFNNLKLTEQKMMKVIALEKQSGVTVSPLLGEYGINSGSVNGLLTQMRASHDIIKLSTGKYEIVDTELKLWIIIDKGVL